MRNNLVIAWLFFLSGSCMICTARGNGSNQSSVPYADMMNYGQVAGMRPAHTFRNNSFSMQEQATPFRDLTYQALRKLYSPKVERVADRLLISGGICVTMGGALLATGLLIEKNSKSGEDWGEYYIPMILGGLGIQAGVGLIIPGSILKIRNHRRPRL